MQKIIIIGSPGAGKSHFARKLSAKRNIPVYHMDNIYWRADQTYISREELVEKVDAIMQTDTWIIDGNYFSTIEGRMERADTIIFLDFPMEICLEGIQERVGKPRTDMPWVEESVDEEFIQFVKDFQEQTKPQMLKLLEKYELNKEILCFYSREESNKFLSELLPETIE